MKAFFIKMSVNYTERHVVSRLIYPQQERASLTLKQFYNICHVPDLIFLEES